MSIKIMSDLLIGQIAAGEVVTRPASAVKELVENSLDAGADHIIIEILEGGLEGIRVKDNGAGIRQQDLGLSIAPHATSKIGSLDDLMSIASFGFRGEALASIAAVAAVSITSRHKESPDAWCLEVDLPQQQPDIKPAAHPIGTTVEVKQLFSKVPVRKRFLATARTQFRHILAVVQQFVLQHDQVAFELIHNGRQVIQAPKISTEQHMMQRHRDVMGHDFVRHALYFSVEQHAMKLSGWLARPEFSKSNHALQFAFVNQRYVRDKLIVKAMKQAYADILYQMRQPVYIIKLEVNADEVDVNVHPSKHEVRFRNSKLIYEFIFRSVQTALAEACAPSAIQSMAGGSETAATIALDEPRDELLAAPQNTLAASVEQVTVSASMPQQAIAAQPAKLKQNPSLSMPQAAAATADALTVPAARLIQEPGVAYQVEVTPAHKSRPAFSNLQQVPADSTCTAALSDQLQTHSLGFAMGQLHQTFIVAEAKMGMILVDMHAAHERIIYEKLKVEFARDGVPSQLLVMPYQLVLNQAQYASAVDLQASLQQVGFQIELQAPATISIKSVPVLLLKLDLQQFVLDLLDQSDSQQMAAKHQLAVNHILGNIACKSAIKTNHKLSLDEMNQLLRDIEKTPYSSYCNHGRPTWRLFTLKQLDQFFLRGQ